MAMDSAIERTLDFLHEAGHLKRLPRTGWLVADVPSPESVAEHSFRTGVIAYVIAVLEGANPDRAAALGLFHDIPETRTGDSPSVGRAYVQTLDAREVAADQVAGLPPALAAHITDLITEHEGAKSPDATPEARCSRDADKLECLLQARRYQEQGNVNMQPYVDSMVRAVTTNTGRKLAQAALEVSPSSWWAGFAEKFGTPQAAVRSA
jgi:putative hydrolase of HD superfamily